MSKNNNKLSPMLDVLNAVAHENVETRSVLVVGDARYKVKTIDIEWKSGTWSEYTLEITDIEQACELYNVHSEKFKKMELVEERRRSKEANWQEIKKYVFSGKVEEVHIHEGSYEVPWCEVIIKTLPLNPLIEYL